MRLLIIGALDGQIGAASQIVLARGNQVSLAEDVVHGLEVLREKGADLVMIDVRRDIKALIESLAAERIHVPVVACGIASDAAAAVRAAVGALAGRWRACCAPRIKLLRGNLATVLR